MPRKPDTQCSVPGCPELVPSGQSKCPSHRAQANQNYERQRDKSIKKKYSESAWRKLRALKLHNQPCCERCIAKGITIVATMVHHKDPVTEGGKFLPELDELESLCTPCHNKEHPRGIIKEKKR